ncbi:MAG: hypothetical protein IJ124_04510 [Clostridia bacterium]|nr:hypothetical protein [Clostridia bacterium]
MAKEKYIQIGEAALRDPVTGEFQPSFPLYMRANDAVIASRERAIRDIARLFAEKMRQYDESCTREGVAL